MEFSKDQWWYQELLAAVDKPGVTDDFKRAVLGVVPRLIEAFNTKPGDIDSHLAAKKLKVAREALFQLRDIAEGSWDTEAVNIINKAIRDSSSLL